MFSVWSIIMIISAWLTGMSSIWFIMRWVIYSDLPFDSKSKIEYFVNFTWIPSWIIFLSLWFGM